MTTKKDNRPKPTHDRLSRNHILKVGVISLVLLCGLAGIAFARYMQTTHLGVPVRVKEFYFTSDLLNDEVENTHTLSPGSSEITFSVGNHADDLRYSEVSINYEVTVRDSKGQPIAEFRPVSGTLEHTQIEDQKITLSDLSPGTYIITAAAKGGEDPSIGQYTKELTATIVVPPKGAQLYQHLDTYEDYILLTVWNEGDESKEVTVKYTGIPDNTNPNMSGWKSSDGTTPQESASITIGVHESKVFRFFGGVASASNALPKPLN